MSDQLNKAYQATPNATLRDQIMNPNFPKNEREWWAAERIEQLEADQRDTTEEFGKLSHDLGKALLEATRLREANELMLTDIRRTDVDMLAFKARIEQLEAALRPFAVAANGFDAQRIKNPEEWFAYSGVTSNAGSVGAITVGDLRRARAALEERT